LCLLCELQEISIELEEQKSKQVVTELRALHASHCEYIIGFHGAFYKDGAIALVGTRLCGLPNAVYTVVHSTTRIYRF